MRNNYEILDIRAFLTLMQLGAFHSAADRLNISQPAFSRRVGNFEETLGVKLFERTTRSVKPTRIAKRLQPVFERILSELDAISSNMSSSVGGRETIVIACVYSAAIKFLPTLINNFLSTQNEVEFSILDGSAIEAMEAVSTGEAHFGLTILSGGYPSLDFIPIITDPFVFLCHDTHPLAGADYVTISDLVGHRLIQLQEASYNRTIVDISIAPVNVELDWTIKVSHLSTVVGLVEAGSGASIVPRMMVDPVSSSHLVAIELREPTISRTIGIAEKKGRTLTPKAKEFRNFINKEWT